MKLGQREERTEEEKEQAGADRDKEGEMEGEEEEQDSNDVEVAAAMNASTTRKVAIENKESGIKDDDGDCEVKKGTLDWFQLRISAAALTWATNLPADEISVKQVLRRQTQVKSLIAEGEANEVLWAWRQPPASEERGDDIDQP